MADVSEVQPKIVESLVGGFQRSPGIVELLGRAHELERGSWSARSAQWCRPRCPDDGEIGPIGMIFVSGVDRISHSPKEFTRWQDSANVLLQTILLIDSAGA
jgi:hypothetical protein